MKAYSSLDSKFQNVHYSKTERLIKRIHILYDLENLKEFSKLVRHHIIMFFFFGMNIDVFYFMKIVI
jgi:hypothetical protein